MGGFGEWMSGYCDYIIITPYMFKTSISQTTHSPCMRNSSIV